jgi:hypothetical protein
LPEFVVEQEKVINNVKTVIRWFIILFFLNFL